MPELVHDCPRCRSRKITHDLLAANLLGTRHDWQHHFEVFCVCRGCHRSSVFYIVKSTFAAKVNTVGELLAYPRAINDCYNLESVITLKDRDAAPPPEHLPKDIDDAFREGATCMVVRCYNAAGTMFRLCLDFATKSLLLEDNVDGLNGKIRFSLGLRLEWLFRTGRLPPVLEELAACVKDNGNDGAHDGTLSQVDAEDLQDFTFELLERLYTDPKRLEIARERRRQRHEKPHGQ